MDIKTRYGFYKYHYFKDIVILSLSLPINIVYFDIGCSVTFYDIIFFWNQALDIPIRKIANSIIVWDLGANKYATNQYAITNKYMPIKDIKKQEVIAYIWREIYPIQELKVNMLISIDIITPE